MRLRTLAGAYAGQIRDYGIVAGFAALRTGMAARVEDDAAVADAPQAPDRPKVIAPRRRQRQE